MSITRRTFIIGSAAAASFAGGFSKPALSSQKREWKMVMTWQKTLPGLGTGAVRLAKRITEMSEGKLTIKTYGGGELVPPLSVFDAVSEGTADMGHSAPYYWLNKHKSTAFFCAVPGGMTAQEQNAWVYFGGGQQLWQELYAPFGLISFPAGNTGTQMGGWFNRTLNTPEDIKGLKMRMPGLAGKVLNRLGGSAQTIPPQELFSAIQSGRIDALEWVGPWNDMALGFHRVARHYYGPGFHEGGAMLELMINKKSYDALPTELKRIIRVAAATENELMAAEYYANNLRAYGVLKKQHVDIREYPAPVLKAFFDTSRRVVSETAESDALAKRIFESYRDFRQNAMEMGGVTEYGFLKARQL